MSKRNKDQLDYLNDYLKVYLPTQRNCLDNTIEAYKITFKLWVKFLKHKKLDYSISTLTLNNVIDFLTNLERDRKISVATRNSRHSHLRGFVKYLIVYCEFDSFKELNKILNSESKKCNNDYQRSYLTINGINLFLKCLEKQYPDNFGIKIIFLLLYTCALRVSELINLKLKDINLKVKNPYISVLGKGNKVRTLFIDVYVVVQVKLYLEKEYRGDLSDSNSFLIIHVFKASRRGLKSENYTRQGISYNLSKILTKFPEVKSEQVGKKLTLHSFRRSRAIHLYLANISLLSISHFLGHSSIFTTEVYIRHKPSDSIDILKIPYTDSFFKKNNSKGEDDKLDRFLNS